MLTNAHQWYVMSSSSSMPGMYSTLSAPMPTIGHDELKFDAHQWTKLSANSALPTSGE
jgi:hypothetical protein